jgi:hypothetical protein
MIEVMIDYIRQRVDEPMPLCGAVAYHCIHGTFAEFPAHDDGTPPPELAAFNTYRWAQHPRRRAADGASVLDVLHAGRMWAYRLEQAFVPLGEGGSRVGLCSFEVGIRRLE